MRAGGYDLDEVPDSEQMRKFAAAGLEAVLADLVAVRPDVILYGCTSATLSMGPDYDREFCARIETTAGLPAVTAAGALTAALHQLGARKVGFCSPYTEELNAEAAHFLELSGIEVVQMAYVGADLGNYGQGDLTPEEVFQLGLRADHADAEAVVMSCTDMRAVEVVERLEAALGKTGRHQQSGHDARGLCPLGSERSGAGALGSAQQQRNPSPAGSGVGPSHMPIDAKPNIATLAPYALAAEAPPGSARVINLAANEFAESPSPAVLEACRAALASENRYPEASARALRQAIAVAHSLKADQIVCANGSSELIGLLATAYSGPGDEVLVARHGYLYFGTVARIAGASVTRADSAALTFDPDAFLAAVTPRTRILFLDNPGNPTCALANAAALRYLREKLPEEVLLVLDSAYGEYVTDPAYSTGTDLVEATDNTVMLRTFSKIYGLAGLRVGWAYAPPAIADVLHRIRQPNNLTGVSIAGALAAMGEQALVLKRREANVALRDSFAKTLQSEFGFTVQPSQTNFLLCKPPLDAPMNAIEIAEALNQRSILIRDMAPYGLSDHLRITVGEAEEMEVLKTEMQLLFRSS